MKEDGAALKFVVEEMCHPLHAHDLTHSDIARVYEKAPAWMEISNQW